MTSGYQSNWYSDIAKFVGDGSNRQAPKYNIWCTQVHILVHKSLRGVSARTLHLIICLPGQECLHQRYRCVKLLHHSDHSEPLLQVEHCQLQCCSACWVAALYAEEKCQRRSLEEPAFCIKKDCKTFTTQTFTTPDQKTCTSGQGPASECSFKRL